jgi:hypothetical protein
MFPVQATPLSLDIGDAGAGARCSGSMTGQ